MKALRKSLSSNRDHHSSHISSPITSPTLSKAALSLPPPTRVIRATSKYRSRAPQQLSFEKGDFFHVIRDIDNQGLWYEAHNPVTGARGLVPRAMFEEFAKGNPTYASFYASLTALVFNTHNLILNLYVVPARLRLVRPRRPPFHHLSLPRRKSSMRSSNTTLPQRGRTNSRQRLEIQFPSSLNLIENGLSQNRSDDLADQDSYPSRLSRFATR